MLIKLNQYANSIYKVIGSSTIVSEEHKLLEKNSIFHKTIRKQMVSGTGKVKCR